METRWNFLVKLHRVAKSTRLRERVRMCIFEYSRRYVRVCVCVCACVCVKIVDQFHTARDGKNIAIVIVHVPARVFSGHVKHEKK